jgi:nucleotide-binding universal stress UspA family protein
MIGKSICTFAEKVGANLIVIGHSSSFSLDHLLLGSNAVYCAKNAKCSVLVAK